MQRLSKESYELYSEKAVAILKETSEKLKILAEKASKDFSVIAKESQEYLVAATENSPEAVKDIVETFASSADELYDISKVREFYVGIPYGMDETENRSHTTAISVNNTLLKMKSHNSKIIYFLIPLLLVFRYSPFCWRILSFMLTGSIAAIRFGIILGGTLLTLSISSLRSWRKGESSPLVLKGQAAIVTILFLRELHILSKRPFIPNFLATVISCGVVAFYLYRMISDEMQSRRSTLEEGLEN